MAWILGIDEAGYGPNLGPFVMTGVLCQLPDAQARTCLWQQLASTARRGSDPRDDRLVIDDSKVVYGSGKGLSGLERGVWVLRDEQPSSLIHLLTSLCDPDTSDLHGEAWFTGNTTLPSDTDLVDLACIRDRFRQACQVAGISAWMLRSVIISPPQFNALVRQGNSKGAVLAYGFVTLLRWALRITGKETLHVWVDKQGGRNTYAAQVQEALEVGMVMASEETMARSRYRVLGLDREIELTFMPRADGTQMTVALASMVSKYVRELCMGEFNAFWQQRVPGLVATAGYPGDARRFFTAIRGAAKLANLAEEAIWRER